MGFLQPQHRVQEHLQSVLIHAGDGLVQHQQIRRGAQRQGQQHPLQFAPGAASQLPLGQSPRLHHVEGLLHPAPGGAADPRPYRPPREGRGQEILHRQGHLPVKEQVLGHVADAHMGDIPPVVVHMADGSAVGQFPQQRPHQGGLARSVLADEHGQLPAVDVHGHVLQKRLPAPLHGHMLQPDMTKGTTMLRHKSLLQILPVRSLFHGNADIIAHIARQRKRFFRIPAGLDASGGV